MATFHTFCVDRGGNGARLFIDGQTHGQEARARAVVKPFNPARWSLGARAEGGFFDGEIAEVVVYARKLPDQERRQVERYLAEKHASLNEAAGVAVQVLVPGFVVRPLPVRLPNVNNVRYRADGTLVAVGYDGKITLLSDSDGDGLEDRVRIFWDDLQARGSLGMALTPPGYPRGQGVFVAANRKLSLVLDTNVVTNDARADTARRYAITLDGLRARTTSGLLQQPAIDVEHDLTGVEATFVGRDGAPKWSGWLPSLDLETSRALTAASAEHGRLDRLLRGSGTLTLRARLDLGGMLRPAAQPGAKLDHELPSEKVTVVFSGSDAVALPADPASGPSVSRAGRNRVSLAVTGPRGPIPVEIELATGRGEPRLEVHWFTNEDRRPRALPLRRTTLPWSVTGTETHLAETNLKLPELHGGNWKRGEALFSSPETACSRCHQVRGQGSKLGPDLSNLIFRDYESVLRDIREPNAALNPDHLQQVVQLAGGEILTGIIQENRAADIVLIDAAGTPTTVPRSRIVSIKASDVSMMPEGLDQAIGPERLRDLLTFLLTPPPGSQAAQR